MQAKEERKEYSRKYDRKIRLEVINHYGGKCALCGDTNPNHLTIDHINGGGNGHRKEIKRQSIYPWLRSKDYPDGFQVLCWNHNAEKQYYKTMTLSIDEKRVELFY